MFYYMLNVLCYVCIVHIETDVGSGTKLKNFHKTQRKKAQAIKDIEKGLSNKEVAANIICQKMPYLHASKNKDKILSSLKQGQNVKQKKLCGTAHEASDPFPYRAKQNNPRLVASYAKELNIFKTSDSWLRRWKERRNITFKKNITCQAKDAN